MKMKKRKRYRTETVKLKREGKVRQGNDRKKTILFSISTRITVQYNIKTINLISTDDYNIYIWIRY